jgi:hypothetical protein
MNALRAGFAVSDITPAPGLPMGGYAQRTSTAVGTADALSCRAAVFDDGATRIALVALDLIYVAGPWARPAREHIAARVRCAPMNILLAATHTHSGPAVFRSGLVDSEALRRYETNLTEIIGTTVDRAASAVEAGAVSFGEAEVKGVGANRREEGGAIDSQVRAIVFRSSEGTMTGVLATYGCHPTVLSPANLHYSRDLFGVAADAAQAELGAAVVLFNGAAGDVSTRFTRRAQDPAEVGRLGTILGSSLVEAARGSVPVPEASLRARVESLPVTLRQFPSQEAAQEEVRRAAVEVQRLREAAVGTPQRRLVAARLEGAMAQLFLTGQGGAEGFLGHRPTEAILQFLSIGGCEVAAIPGEMFSLAGADVCARRPRPTLLVGYANDYLGYFVSPEAVADGGYESLISLLDSVSVQQLAHRLRTFAFDA